MKEVKQVTLTFGSGDLKYTVEVFFDPPLNYTPKTKLTVESEKPFKYYKIEECKPFLPRELDEIEQITQIHPEDIAKKFVTESLKPSEDLTGRWITRGGHAVIVKQANLCNGTNNEWEVALGDFTYYLYANGNFNKFGEHEYDLMKRLPEGYPENPLVRKL